MISSSEIRLVMADIDIFCKLAAWDLLDHIPELFQCTWKDVATLSTLKYRILREINSSQFRLLCSLTAAEKALSILGAMQQLPEAETERITTLQAIPTVDPGEAILFAIAAQYPLSYLLTGDKRAVIGVATAAQNYPILRLNKQVVCLEQVIRALLLTKGIDWLRSKVCPRRCIDKAIGNVMGSKCDSQYSAVDDGLQSYVSDLAGKCGEFLSDIHLTHICQEDVTQ